MVTVFCHKVTVLQATPKVKYCLESAYLVPLQKSLMKQSSKLDPEFPKQHPNASLLKLPQGVDIGQESASF